MAVHGVVPQREGLEVLEREMAEAYNARSAELKHWTRPLCRPGVVQAWQYVRHDHVHRPLCRKLERAGKEAALPQGAEADLSAPDALLQMPHPHNDGGYAVEDFDTVDPALGTNKIWKT